MFFVFSLNIYVYIYILYICFWNWNAINFCKLFALVLFLSFFLLLSFKLFSFSSHYAFRLFRGARWGRGSGEIWGLAICMVWLMHLWPICMYMYTKCIRTVELSNSLQGKGVCIKNVLPAFRRLLSLSNPPEPSTAQVPMPSWQVLCVCMWLYVCLHVLLLLSFLLLLPN